MNTIELKKYGPIISDKLIGEEVYEIIKSQLDSGELVVDLEGIISMATYCAKQIFGKLYLELGPDVFFKKIAIKNASSDIKLIINMGINSALDDQK